MERHSSCAIPHFSISSYDRIDELVLFDIAGPQQLSVFRKRLQELVDPINKELVPEKACDRRQEDKNATECNLIFLRE
jgi:hypothetical protein